MTNGAASNGDGVFRRYDEGNSATAAVRGPAAIAALFLALAGSVQAADPLARIGGFTGGAYSGQPRQAQNPPPATNRQEAIQRYGAPVTGPVGPPDVREIGGTNYYVHVRVKGQPLPQWQSLHAKVVRITKDGVVLEKATETLHTERYKSRDPLNRIGGGGGRDPGLTSWTEVEFTCDGELILLVRYPAAKGLIAGQKIKALAMRAGTHELRQGVPIARFDYGRPVSEAELKAQTAR